MYKYPMIKWAKDLYPICRSITGEGARKTLSYFKKLNPEFKKLQFKTGQKVFDWVIPKEWNIRDAYLEHESGKRFAEFKKCNLHVVGYSKPVSRKMSKEELLSHIYTQKDQPDAIPYVTSYYKERWGFCLSENQKKELPEGIYKVFIDSDLKKGNLELSHAIFKGKSKKEIFFSSYICHPSMVNNELSGPVLMNAIMHYIKSNYSKTKYTYRFVLLPETIGSIAYLSKVMKVMKSNIICGFNLTCAGDERGYCYTSSRHGNTLADDAIKAALFGMEKVKKYSFLDRGGDETSVKKVKAETSKSFDIGVEKSFINLGLNVDVSYFNLEYYNTLEGDWEAPWQTLNYPGTVKSEGLEFMSKWKTNDLLNFNLNYTYTSTYDGAEQDNPNKSSSYYNAQIVRVPRHMLNLATKVKFSNYKNLNLTLNTKWSDTVRDYGNNNNGSWNDVRLDDYLVNDLSLNYKLYNMYNIYFDIKNIFDEKYNTALQYSQMDRTFNFGIKKVY